MVACTMLQNLIHVLRRCLPPWGRATSRIQDPRNDSRTSLVEPALDLVKPESDTFKKQENNDGLGNIRVIKRVPVYVDVEALEEVLASLEFLERVSCGSHCAARGERTLYLEFQKGSPFEERLPTAPLNIDGQQCPMFKLELSQTDMLQQAITMFSKPADVTSTDARLSFVKDSLPLPECQHCGEIIIEKFNTPCVNCCQLICNECLQRNFEVALRDHEAMPVSCCSIAMHPDVATDIISNDQRQHYKMRFEEMCVKKPFFCSTPSCSAFIPPRKLRIIKGVVTCHKCKAKTCFNCRHEASISHNCAYIRAQEDKMLESFGYKRCPNCGTGLARMFGCAHMRCPCGAHWCWNCETLTSLCYCSETRGEDRYSGESIWEESDDETTETSTSPISDTREQMDESIDDKLNDADLARETSLFDITNIIHRVVESASTPTQAPDNMSVTQDAEQSDAALQPEVKENAVEAENLDLYDSGLEYDEDHDFGADPGDRVNDPWDCPHVCVDFNRYSVPKYWMASADPKWRDIDANGQWERSIACMLCQRHAKITLPETRVENPKETAHMCFRCGVICCGRCNARIKRRVRTE